MRRSMHVLARGAGVLAATVALSLGPTTAAFADKPASPPAEDKAKKHERAEDAKQQKPARDATPNQGRTQPGCDGSHHSATVHGANTDGPDNPYHNTCDGSPSGNGNGDGEAKGRPCAGCVGNADDKNPPGQAPGGSDHNAGYECDRNHGIGRTNPAHTGCAAPAPAPVVVPARCPDGTAMKDVDHDGVADAKDCVKPPPTCATGCVEPQATCPGGAPMTDVNGDGVSDVWDCATVKTVTKDRVVPASVLSGTRIRTDRPVVAGVTLPVTGSGTSTAIGLALVLVAAGAVLVSCSSSGRDTAIA